MSEESFAPGPCLITRHAEEALQLPKLENHNEGLLRSWRRAAAEAPLLGHQGLSTRRCTAATVRLCKQPWQINLPIHRLPPKNTFLPKVCMWSLQGAQSCKFFKLSWCKLANASTMILHTMTEPRRRGPAAKVEPISPYMMFVYLTVALECADLRYVGLLVLPSHGP